MKELNKFETNDKNKTLFKVIQDNMKTLERRILPLLEMFKVECAFFREVQSICIKVINEKKELENSYKGRVKINKNQAIEFT